MAPFEANKPTTTLPRKSADLVIAGTINPNFIALLKPHKRPIHITCGIANYPRLVETSQQTHKLTKLEISNNVHLIIQSSSEVH